MAGDLVFITGATGHIGARVLLVLVAAGHAVRISIRKEEQAQQLKAHPLVAKHVDQLDFVVVPDITADGAFDNVLEGVKYIQHIASPLPRPTEDFERDIVQTAIRGTTNILKSALNYRAIRRVVITSSLVAITPHELLYKGDPDVVLTPQSRVRPRPTGPYKDVRHAYQASKALALDATETFVADHKPHFSIVNIHPGYVIGTKDLATSAEDACNSSNMAILPSLTGETGPITMPRNLVGLTDVARIHLAALDESKVKVSGSAVFLLDSQRPSFDEAADIVRARLPEANKAVGLPLNGTVPWCDVRYDVTETVKVFGPLDSYEDDVVAFVEQLMSFGAAKAQTERTGLQKTFS